MFPTWDPSVAVGVFFVAVGFVLVAWKSGRRKSPNTTVPFATYNVLSVIKGITSSEPYLYLYQLSQECNQKTFRLALPIFKIKRISSWGSSSIMYVPLPQLKKVFVVGDIALVRRILQDPLSDKPCEIFSSFEGITNHTPVMFTSGNSDYTKSVRRAAHAAFASSHKKNRMPQITQSCIDQWIHGRLYKLSQTNESFDPVEEALSVTFYIICEAAFGYQATYEEFKMFTRHLDVALSEFAYRQSTNPLRKLLGWFLPSVWKAKASSKVVMGFAEHMMDSYTNQQKQQLDTDTTTSREKKGETFMDWILQNPKLKNNKRQQASEILMFMAAGHETTGAVISNIMIQLAKHTDVQDTLRQSLRSSYEKQEKLHDNPYLQNVVREANRFFPVAAMGSTRVTGRPFLLPNHTTTTSYSIPADSICFLPQYLCYRDADIFPHPDVFDPDRWEKSTPEMDDAAGIAFSLGPRSCPGKPLAIEEMNQILPPLLLSYSLQIETESRPFYCVILKHSHARIKIHYLGEEVPPVVEEEERKCPLKSSYMPEDTRRLPTTSICRMIFAAALFVLLLVGKGGMINDSCWVDDERPAHGTTGGGAFKIAVLTEPSPIGSYICGQSKRIEYLMQYLVETANDSVQLITTEVHDTVKPSLWNEVVPVHYTYGVPLPSYNPISISFDWNGKALRELYRFRPDLIHATTPGPLLFPSILASRMLGIPIVLSCHTHLTAYARTYLPPIVNVIAEWFLWRFTATVHSFADMTLVTSPPIQDEFLRHGIPRVYVWQKGVNATQFHPAYSNADMRYRMTEGHPDDFLIVYIGRLADEKRLVVLKGVLQNIPNARLCLVGTGPYETKLREHFQDTKTVFLGQLTDRVELSQAFASADVFCMPSTSETLGFVVLESMASGVPVVAANAGGLKHLIENGKTGFLVTPDVESEFVARIQELRENRELRDRITDAARKDIQQWTWESSMEQLRFQFYTIALEKFEDRWEQRIWRVWKQLLKKIKSNVTS